MFQSSNVLIRQFLTHTDRDGKSSGNVGLQDPTYLGFTVKFSFHNDEIRDQYGRWNPTQIPTGLLLPPENLESAIHYLQSVGRQDKAEYIKQFREELLSIERDKPWYFQSITGLNELMKIPEGGSAWRGKDKVLTFECLESVDMQLSFLADLYRKGSFEFAFMRELLPDAKKLFSMTIIVSEIRNLHILDNEIKAILDNVNLGYKPTTEGIMDIRGVDVSAVRAKAGDNVYTSEPEIDVWDLKNATDYYDKFKDELSKKSDQAEKAWNNAKETWDGLTFGDGDEENAINGVAASKQTNISTSQATALNAQTPGTTTSNPPGITKIADPPNKEVVGSSNYLTDLKARLGDLVQKADNAITFYVFNLNWCEFVFDEYPWLDTVTNAYPDAPASMRFKIKVGGISEVNQYGFKEWILADDSNAAGSPQASALKGFNDQKNNWSAWTSPKRDSLGEYSTNLERATSSDGKTSKERSIKNQKARDDSWTAKARRFGQAGKDVLTKYGPAAVGIISAANPELGKAISKLEDDAAKAKLGVENILKQGYKNAGDIVKQMQDIDLSDPMSVFNAFKKLDEAIKNAQGKKPSDTEKVWTVYSNWEEMRKNKKTAEDFDLTGNTWKERGGSVYPNVDLQLTPKKEEITWKYVSLKDSPSYKKNESDAITPIEFSPPHVTKEITPLSFEAPSKTDNISPLDFTKPSVSENIAKLSFDTPSKVENISSLSFDKAPISKNITPLSFDKAPIVTGITPLNFEKAPISDNITPLNFEKAPISDNITPLKFDKAPIATGITPLSFDKAPIVTGITPLNFEKAPISENITPIQLVGAGFNGQITPKKLEFGLTKLENKITPKNIYE